MRALSIPAPLAALALLAACGAAQPPRAAAPASLDGTAWVLAEAAGAPAEFPLTLNFEAERLTGVAPCNNFFGAWGMQGADAIAIGPLAATRRACAQLALEADYLNALTEATRAQVGADSLTLFGPGGAPVMRFLRAR
ncbi:MAG: META domain-containing protein [Rubrimonas sp.]